jgi:uncharacterized protein YqjF (DUF2071 family)
MWSNSLPQRRDRRESAKVERPFLRATWRSLAMISYEVDPALLGPLVPAGTELDRFGGRCFVSVVGFMFLDVRVLGIAVPLHTRFEEVNLRFYVRRDVDGETRRGVVFVRELVPLPAVALVARLVYGERYSALPMRHRDGDALVSYEWRTRGRWEGLELAPAGDWAAAGPGSEEEFVTEHYWGYAAGRRGTVEYRVAHPRWRVSRARSSRVVCDAERLYGGRFAAVLDGPPTSAFLADGSAVEVWPGRRI